MLSTSESLYSEVSLLDARRFPSIDALRVAAEATSHPSLLLVDAIDLNEVLKWLDDKDDVCLWGSPPELVDNERADTHDAKHRRSDSAFSRRQP
jgi:hypothetical protein